MKSKAKTIRWIITAILLAAIIGGAVYLDRLLDIATGYAAKNMASAVFVSGRDPQEVQDLDLSFSIIKKTRSKVDYENGTVTSRLLWNKSTALYRPGFGVTLVKGIKLEKLRSLQYPLPLDIKYDPSTTEWPMGDLYDSSVDSLEEKRGAVRQIADAFVDELSYGGHPFSFVVLHKGVPMVEKYAKGIDRGTKLLSWSMAKSFTEAVAGVMYGDGLVDIYAPMDIPEWKNDNRKDITIDDLLRMHSGLKWNEDYGALSHVNIMLHAKFDMGLYAQEKELEYDPASHWYYSSGSTNIAMRYLMGRFPSAKDFYAYMRERLFFPIGIQEPIFEVDAAGVPVGSSYLYLRSLDFARFGLLYLQDGVFNGRRVLPEGWVDYTATPTPGSADGYGSGFWLNKGGKCPDVPADMFSCNGHDGQQIYIIPSKGLVVTVNGFSHLPEGRIDFNRLLKDVIDALE